MKKGTWAGYALVAAVALSAGAAVGFGLGSRKAAPEIPATKSGTPSGGKMISESPAVAATASLRAKVRELEKALELAQKQSTNAVAEVPPGRPGVPHEGMRERLERLKNENPARYAQVTNSIARFSQMRRERARARDEMLSSVDVSRMSPQGRKVHARYMELSAKRDELMDSMQREDVTDEERRATWGRIHQMGESLHEAAAAERVNLLNEMARDLGFEGEDAMAIAETVREVVDATDPGFGWMPHGRGGRGNGRGPR